MQKGPASCHYCASRGALVSPVGRQDADRLVVPRQAVDTRLDQNQAELGVLVLAVAFEVLPNGDGLSRAVVSPKAASREGRPPRYKPYLLDQHIQVLGNIRG